MEKHVIGTSPPCHFCVTALFLPLSVSHSLSPRISGIPSSLFLFLLSLFPLLSFSQMFPCCSFSLSLLSSVISIFLWLSSSWCLSPQVLSVALCSLYFSVSLSEQESGQMRCGLAKPHASGSCTKSRADSATWHPAQKALSEGKAACRSGLPHGNPPQASLSQKGPPSL